MSWLSDFFGGNQQSNQQSEDDTRLGTASEFIEEHTALYRHYCIPEVQRHVKQFTGQQISHDEAVGIVQAKRDVHGMGPIEWYNLMNEQEREDAIARGDY